MLQLDQEFGPLILSIIAMNIQCAFAGAAIGGVRKKYGVKYPDMGSGIYTKKLTEAQWEDFNK